MKLKLVLIASALLLVVGSVTGYLYWNTTPTYALYQLKKALQNKDAVTAERYVDLDKIAEDAGEWIFQSTPMPRPANALSLVKTTIRSVFEKRVLHDGFPSTPRLTQMEVFGAEARATLQYPNSSILHLRMSKTDRWKVVGMEELNEWLPKQNPENRVSK